MRDPVLACYEKEKFGAYKDDSCLAETSGTLALPVQNLLSAMAPHKQKAIITPTSCNYNILLPQTSHFTERVQSEYGQFLSAYLNKANADHNSNHDRYIGVDKVLYSFYTALTRWR